LFFLLVMKGEYVGRKDSCQRLNGGKKKLSIQSYYYRKERANLKGHYTSGGTTLFDGGGREKTCFDARKDKETRGEKKK